MGSLLTAGRQTIGDVVLGSNHEPEATSNSTRSPKPIEVDGTSPEHSIFAAGHKELPSPSESNRSMAVSEDTGYHTAIEGHRSSEYSNNTLRSSQKPVQTLAENHNDGLNETVSSTTIVKTPSSPPVPPRPTVLRPGGLLSRRRAKSSRDHPVGESVGRSMEQRIQTISAPNMKVIMEPGAQNDDPKLEPHESIPSEWVDLVQQSPETKASLAAGKRAGARHLRLSPLSGESDASSDTVVEWSPNANRIPVPTMTLSPAPVDQSTPTLKRSLASKPKKPSPASLDLNHSARSDDTVVQWSSSLKKSPRLFDIHKDLIDSSTAGPSVAADQTPPPDISLVPSTDSRLPISKVPSALRETSGNPTSPSGSPHKAAKLHEVPGRQFAYPSMSSQRSPEAIFPHGPQSVRAPQYQSPPDQPLPASPQTYTPIGAPPFSSPSTFTPPGPPPTAPPLPPRTHPAHFSTNVILPETLFAQLGDQLQHALHKDMKAFRRDIHGEFEKQRVWVEGAIRERDHWVRRLEEENGRLREELARVRAGRRR